MASITFIAKNTIQPSDGFLPTKCFEKIQLTDDLTIKTNPSISNDIFKTTINSLTNFIFTNDVKKAFSVAITAAMQKNEGTFLKETLDQIKGLDDQSIVASCKIACYEVNFRNKTLYDPNTLEINHDAIENVKILVTRCYQFINQFGPIIKHPIIFDGGYSKKIDNGYGDLLTDGTIWRIKITDDELNIEDTLHLLLTYIMGKHSNYIELQKIYKIALFNPQKNCIYIYDTDLISHELIKQIETEVIEY